MTLLLMRRVMQSAFGARAHERLSCLATSTQYRVFCRFVRTVPCGPGFIESEIQKVDRHGRFDAAREDRRPRWLMWPSDRAARVIVDAIARRRREVVFTGHGKVAAFLGMHAPRLVDAVMSLPAMRRQAGGFAIDR